MINYEIPSPKFIYHRATKNKKIKKVYLSPYQKKKKFIYHLISLVHFFNGIFIL